MSDKRPPTPDPNDIKPGNKLLHLPSGRAGEVIALTPQKFTTSNPVPDVRLDDGYVFTAFPGSYVAIGELELGATVLLTEFFSAGARRARQLLDVVGFEPQIRSTLVRMVLNRISTFLEQPPASEQN